MKRIFLLLSLILAFVTYMLPACKSQKTEKESIEEIEKSTKEKIKEVKSQDYVHFDKNDVQNFIANFPKIKKILSSYTDTGVLEESGEFDLIEKFMLALSNVEEVKKLAENLGYATPEDMLKRFIYIYEGYWYMVNVQMEEENTQQKLEELNRSLQEIEEMLKDPNLTPEQKENLQRLKAQVEEQRQYITKPSSVPIKVKFTPKEQKLLEMYFDDLQNILAERENE